MRSRRRRYPVAESRWLSLALVEFEFLTESGRLASGQVPAAKWISYVKLLAFLLAIISAQEITIKIANKKLNLKHFDNDSSQFGQLMVAVSEAGRASEGERKRCAR